MYKKRTKSWLKHADFLIVDLLVLNLSYFLSYYMYLKKTDLYLNDLYSDVAFYITLVDVIAVAFFGTLKNVMKRNVYQELVATIKQAFVIMAFMVIYLFSIKKAFLYSRGVFYITLVMYVFMSFVFRLVYRHFLKLIKAKRNSRSLFIITTKEEVEETLKNIKSHNYSSYFFAGMCILDEDMSGQVIDGIEVKAGSEEVAEYLCRNWVDEVAIVIPDDYKYPEELINSITDMGIAVHYKLKHFSNVVGQEQVIEKLGDYTVLTTTISYASNWELFIKRTMDIIGGFIGCVATILLTVIIGPIIYIKSPGPIFFSQVRMGRNGRKFKMYKFRSMHLDAEERKAELMSKNKVKDGLMFKMDFDPRIIGNVELPDGTKKTGIGQFIRKTSLDEFPQFFNVLKGDMSLVGTRPPTVDEWNKYKLHHRSRLAAKPGITGMWQVSGRSNITDFDEIVKLDREYITNWSLGKDIMILFKTIAVIFKHEGAM